MVGLLLIHPCFAAVAETLSMHPYIFVAVVVFASYVAGLILFSASHLFSLLLWLVLVWLSSKLKWTPSRSNTKISGNPVWRRVAAAFLGDELKPVVPASASADWEDQMWNDWYNILQDYVLRSVPVLRSETHFIVTIVQATSWAIIILSIISRIETIWTILFFLLFLLPYAATPFATQYGYRKYDRLSPPDLVARLLAEIRGREANTNRQV